MIGTRKSNINGSQGFTLIEVLLGILIMGIILAGLTSVFDSTVKKQKKLREKAHFDNSFKGFGQRFQQLLKGADVASSFQLLPVNFKSCGSDGPCFFSMSAKGDMGNLSKKHLGGLRGINFFSDRGIKALDRAFLTKSHPSRIKYFKKPRYPGEVKVSRAKRYFVGWKLKSLNKQPFTMMTRSDFPGYLEFPVVLGTHKPADKYVVLKGSSSGLPYKNLKDKLVVFYNGFNNKTYFFSKIKTAGVCLPSNICVDIVRQRNPAVMNDFKKKFASKDYYYLALEEPTDIGSFTASTGVRMVGSWWGQNSSEYSFPYKRTTVYDATPDGKDLRKADPHTLEHYLHTLINPETKSKVNSQIFALPVSFKKLYLTKQTDKTKKLIMRTYEDSKKVKTILSDLPMNAEIYFSRQLSTNKISAFVIKPDEKKKKK